LIYQQKYAFLTCCQKGRTFARPRLPPLHRGAQAVRIHLLSALGEAVQRRNTISYKFKSYRDGKVVNIACKDGFSQLWRPWRTPSLAEETRNDRIAITPITHYHHKAASAISHCISIAFEVTESGPYRAVLINYTKISGKVELKTSNQLRLSHHEQL
jgi:hypothetical protein